VKNSGSDGWGRARREKEKTPKRRLRIQTFKPHKIRTEKHLTLYTRSPFVPRSPWLAPCGRWNFLWDRVGFIGSDTVFIICLFIYLYLRCKVYFYLVKQTKIVFWHKKSKQPSLPSRNNKLLFLCWPHHTPPHSHQTIHHLTRTKPYTTSLAPNYTPPHSHQTLHHLTRTTPYTTSPYRSPTRLLASVTQFRYLLLNVLPFKAVCMQPLLLITNGFLNERCSLNLRRTVPNCPQLTPAIALSVVRYNSSDRQRLNGSRVTGYRTYSRW
jgi:hypothetical protein